MRPTRIGDKYKEVIKKLSDDFKEEGGNTKKIEKLNKSIPYVELFIEHLRKNPDILNKYFNISEDDDSEIINIWNKINDLRILEKINLDENKITEMKLPHNLVKNSTVLSLADIPVVIDLHNTQIRPIENLANYHYNTVSFPLHRNNSIILANQGPLMQFPRYPQYRQYLQYPQYPQHLQHLQYPQHMQYHQYPQNHGYPHYTHRSAPPLAHRSAPPLAHRSAPPLAPRSAPPLAPRSAPPLASQLRPQFPKVLQVKPISSNKLTSMIINDVNGYRDILLNNRQLHGGKSKNNKVTGANVKETKILFTKLLKSNKYIKYNKHLYVRYDKYLLSVPVLIAYITYNKKLAKKSK
jgi:hypothetical protein